MTAGWFLLFLALHGSAQDSFQSPEFKIHTDVELVLLDVSVKNPSGGYVSGLTRDRFQIYENGVPQKITEFAVADVPVAVGLVMDQSGSMQPRRSSLIEAGVAFIEASNPQDQIFVVNFNDKARLGLPDSAPFTDDINLLREALSKHRPEGQTALYDAVALALKHLESGRRDKKALVVISDGGDNGSTHRLKDVMRLIEESAATIYTVGIFDPDDPDRNPGVLKRIASVSGGECFLPGELEPILPICQKIAKDIRSRYTIGYTPVRTGDKAADPEDPRDGWLTGIREIDCANAHGISAARPRGDEVIIRFVLRRSTGASRAGPWIFAQWVLLITGLLAVGYTAFHVAARYVYQAYENRVFDHAVALQQAASRLTKDSAARSRAGAVAVRSLVGKIEIPRLNISAIVKEGVDERTLGLAAGHIPHTALPGQAGNVGVAAHRDTLFRNLKDVRRDDKITLTTLDGEYVYRVVSFQIVQPTDVSVLDPSPNEKTLTLVTCYPFYFVGHAPKRFIVRALQVFC